MSPQKEVKVISGAAQFTVWSPEDQKAFFATLDRHGVKDLDTAYIYPNSEKVLGEYEAIKKYSIHTKTPAFLPKSLGKQSLLDGAKRSEELLGGKNWETYFFHAPDPQTPIEESLEAMQEIFKSGTFKHLGLSNFTPEQVRETYDVAKKNGYVLPTVYQGNYNAVARNYETTLFPVLRELGISFQAYSPIAGGFLTKSAAALREGTADGRFAKDNDSIVSKIYHAMYNRPEMYGALQRWEQLAKANGLKQAEMAYRWVKWNSGLRPERGDALIIGGNSVAQLEETLAGLERGPLSPEIAKEIDEIWQLIKDVAPTDNSEVSGKL